MRGINMKIKKIFKLIICLFVFMFVSGCVKDSQKVSAITPSIETLENYEITTYLGKEVSYKLTDKEIEFVNNELPYFYQGQYFTADTTRIPLVELTCFSNTDKIKFICALDNNEKQCYMLYINSVSYNIKVDKEFKEEHNVFSYLFGLAESNIKPFE